MPLLDGDEACLLIKNSNPKVKVIAITAYADPTKERQISSKGFDGYITKPFDPLYFQEMITKFMQ